MRGIAVADVVAQGGMPTEGLSCTRGAFLIRLLQMSGVKLLANIKTPSTLKLTGALVLARAPCKPPSAQVVRSHSGVP